MPVFHFRALDSSGEVVEGQRESPDKASLARRLRDEGYMPLKLDTGMVRREPAGWRLFRRRGRMMTADGLALFTRQLATLIGADLPADRALATIAQSGDASATSTAAQAVMDALRGGASLADAMAARPDEFSASYVALVRAGEASGALAQVLEDLATSLTRARALEREVRGALTYPVLVVVATMVAIAILLGAVIPEFKPLFEDAGDALPATAELVLGASDVFRAYWREAAGVLLLLLLVLPRLAQLPAFRRWIDGWFLRLPALGRMMRAADAARFCRALATLLANEVDAAPALEMSAATVRNVRLSRALDACLVRVRRGEGLAGPLEASGGLPPLAIQLIRAGEVSSRLPAMLATTADILETDLRRDTQRMVNLIAPAVTLLLGVLVALIIGAILSAIMTAYDLPL